MLKELRTSWAPESFIVSFKLETDPDLVLPKARIAIQRYGVDLVVANQLQTRRDVVYLVKDTSPDSEVLTIRRARDCDNIEPFLVKAVVEAHTAFLTDTVLPALTEGCRIS